MTSVAVASKFGGSSLGRSCDPCDSKKNLAVNEVNNDSRSRQLSQAIYSGGRISRDIWRKYTENSIQNGR